MPRPCAAVAHVGHYASSTFWSGCHGLVPWWFTLVSTQAALLVGMPRPCAVVVHVGLYSSSTFARDATALCRGGSRWSLRKQHFWSGCHGLVPWWFTFVSTQAALLVGMPRPCAVVVHVCLYASST